MSSTFSTCASSSASSLWTVCASAPVCGLYTVAVGFFSRCGTLNAVSENDSEGEGDGEGEGKGETKVIMRLKVRLYEKGDSNYRRG